MTCYRSSGLEGWSGKRVWQTVQTADHTQPNDTELKKIKYISFGLKSLLNLLFGLNYVEEKQNEIVISLRKRGHISELTSLTPQEEIFQNTYSIRHARCEPKKPTVGASLVAHWLRICLPMQGTRIRALVQEDPTRRGATKPVRHNY